MFIFVATAMNYNNNKGKAKYILASMLVVLFITVTLASTYNIPHRSRFYKTLTSDTIPTPSGDSIIVKKSTAVDLKDTIPFKDSLNRKDSLIVAVDTFDFKVSKDSLDAPVVYHADDSMVMDVPGKKILLYGKEAKVTYTDNELTAPGIQFDQRTNMVTAFLRKDSLGKVL